MDRATRHYIKRTKNGFSWPDIEACVKRKVRRGTHSLTRYLAETNRVTTTRMANRKIDIQRLRQVLANNVEHLCEYFFPEGKRRGKCWAIPQPSKKGKYITVLLVGDRRGTCCDWASGQRWDFVGLLQAKMGATFVDTVSAIESVLGTSLRLRERARSQKHEYRRHSFSTRRLSFNSSKS